ncbi:hypothetical protein HDU93_000962 [Gonapodya sp. JEL0774]|nr:hypothetical protein HDU93_000962 [Gonapodya sp. JEL0774]
MADNPGDSYRDRGKAVVRDTQLHGELALHVCIRSMWGEDIILALPDSPEITLRDIKLKLERDHPNHPPPTTQALIYGGRILKDDELLKNVFKRADPASIQTLIMVSRGAPPSFLELKPNRVGTSWSTSLSAPSHLQASSNVHRRAPYSATTSDTERLSESSAPAASSETPAVASVQSAGNVVPQVVYIK